MLLDEEALIGCSGSADDESCLSSCIDSSEMGSRLLESLLAVMGRVSGMREFIIDSTLQRAQGLTPLAGDFVSRFVSAAAMAVAGGPPGPGNDGGKPDTWPVGGSIEKAVRPAGQPPCYRDDTGKCLPGFLVIGPQKTGTSALYEYLNVHPQLNLNLKKELLHWGPPKGPNSGKFNCSDSYVSTYLDKFHTKVSVESGQMTGDFSATDIACACCPEATRTLIPHAKIIVLMRDPVERARSRYREQYAITDFVGSGSAIGDAVKRDGVGCDARCLGSSLAEHVRRNLPLLEDCIRSAPTVGRRVECIETQQVLGWSMYGHMVSQWLQSFSLEQMMLIKSEALGSRPAEVLRDIETFLEIEHTHYDQTLISTAFNTKSAYGWHVGETGEDKEQRRSSSTLSSGSDEAADLGSLIRVDSMLTAKTECDETCEKAADLVGVELTCLQKFYEANVGVFDVASRFFKTEKDTCRGEACSFAEVLLPQSGTQFNASKCLASRASD